MRSYCAIYVDAGYLLASAATRVTGTSLRGGVVIAYRELIEAMIDQVEQDSGLPLLRVNWYDAGGGQGGAPDAWQDQIGMLPRLKLRLGRMSPGGEQKGVDLRIGLDLATHGRNRVADVIYLVSGDDDLTEAVEEAQGHGVQVMLLAAPDRHGRPHAVSRNLQREADGTALIDPVIIDRFVKPRPKPAPAPLEQPEETVERASVPTPAALAASRPWNTPIPPVRTGDQAAALHANHTPHSPPRVVYSSTTGRASVGDASLPPEIEKLVDEVVHGVVATWKSTVTDAELRAVRSERPYIPRDLDRTMLLDMSARLGMYDVDERTRLALRERFWLVLGPSSAAQTPAAQ
ncbi:MAG: NYN domain-containing protein [Intrasporangium sp.]|uniref:NYN domain-containing protein n=1 Tax=Intrasporangium sp. TaxID=1925024 RepID=UPI002648636F|nr:NYN domain-containing protein [Intrasporangium sp.]MDN5797237.1 NYN domain-containing protein [Intrasporangium sp.]